MHLTNGKNFTYFILKIQLAIILRCHSVTPRNEKLKIFHQHAFETFLALAIDRQFYVIKIVISLNGNFFKIVDISLSNKFLKLHPDA